MHSPYYRILETAEVAVIFVHGILGTPRHFDPLLEMVPEHISIANLLLEGHGGSVKDFSRGTFRQWEQQLNQAILMLKEQHTRIVIVGHSIGALLALCAAMEHSCISGLLLLNPALTPRLTPSMMARNIRLAFGKPNPNDPGDTFCLQGSGIRLEPYPWRYFRWIPNFLTLFQKAISSRQIPSKLQIPCSVFLCRNDELVNPKAIKYFSKNTNITVTMFEKGYHYGYTDNQRQMIGKSLQELIK